MSYFLGSTLAGTPWAAVRLLLHRGSAVALPQGSPSLAPGLSAGVGGAAILWREAPQAFLWLVCQLRARSVGLSLHAHYGCLSSCHACVAPSYEYGLKLQLQTVHLCQLDFHNVFPASTCSSRRLPVSLLSLHGSTCMVLSFDGAMSVFNVLIGAGIC